MGQSAKVAITLPTDIYRQVERLRKRSHTSRSAMVQRALVLLLNQADKQERVRAYVEGYRKHPETDEEIRAAHASAVDILTEVVWE